MSLEVGCARLYSYSRDKYVEATTSMSFLGRLFAHLARDHLDYLAMIRAITRSIQGAHSNAGAAAVDPLVTRTVRLTEVKHVTGLAQRVSVLAVTIAPFFTDSMQSQECTEPSHETSKAHPPP